MRTWEGGWEEGREAEKEPNPPLLGRHQGPKSGGAFYTIKTKPPSACKKNPASNNGLKLMRN